MRCMARNKRELFYALQASRNEIEDEYGNKTGQYEILYTKPMRVRANVSAGQGEVQTRQFGESENYDKVIVLDDVNTPINEYAILWVDTLPRLNEEGDADIPHDYVVKKIARSLNSVSIAISKVNVR